LLVTQLGEPPFVGITNADGGIHVGHARVPSSEKGVVSRP
jgi:hypothetical protein